MRMARPLNRGKMMTWSTAGTCSNSRVLASLVEVVDAFTIVLAVATLRGWRPGARYDRRPRRTGRHCPADGTASRPRPHYRATARNRDPAAALWHGLVQESARCPAVRLPDPAVESVYRSARAGAS
jgi:hypothetical protein